MSRLEYLRDIEWGELTGDRIAAAVWRRLRDVPHRIAWHLSPLAKRNRDRLSEYRDCHKGQRGWVIANGPSLAETDLDKLQSEITIGMNRIYRAQEKWGFMPDYITVMDLESQLYQTADDLAQLEVPKFINWNARTLLKGDPHTTFLKGTFRPRFSTDLRKGIWGGHSVTFACLQVAYHMGFEEIVLIGKDHSYREEGVPGEVMVSSGDEQNHFIKGYYSKGAVWRIPDYKGEELAYELAREGFEADGRRVLDATVNGKLNVFPKVPYESLV